MNFLLQFDEGICLSERRAVVHAVCLLPDSSVLRRPLADLQAAPFPGDLSHLSDYAPVGTVEFCRAWMQATGVTEPAPIDYPDALQNALGRVVRRTTFAQAAVGSWIKPVRTKAWEPRVKQDQAILPADEPVWDAPVIPKSDWLAEWRVYVVGGKIIGAGRYDDLDEEEDLVVDFDHAAVQSWVDAYTASGQSPAGYALDVALWPNGQTVLIEVTDGWAIGYYRGDCSAVDYARLLHARWMQIAGQSEAGKKEGISC